MPTSPHLTVEEAVERFRYGEFLIVADDADRENEGDLVIAAEWVTPTAVNFMAREGRGLVCVAMTGDRLDALGLPPMVPPDRNGSGFGTAFAVSVEARSGVTTGISAADRARTIRLLADPATTAADLVSPGHVFPLRARPGGVLERRGQTEAGVDLARLAGLHPAAVICEIANDDGSMARMPDLEHFAERHGIGIVTVAALAEHRRRQEAPAQARRAAETRLPTPHGTFTLVAYASPGREPDLALVMGDVADGAPVLARLHSECLTGDVLGSGRCDCGAQLDHALAAIAAEGRGVLLYLRQEGRGIGLIQKLRAYALQDDGLDTVEANQHLGLPADAREYGNAAAMLRDLGVAEVRLLTNNPRKVDGLGRHGVTVAERVPLLVPPGPDNAAYLRTKREKLGHLLTA